MTPQVNLCTLVFSFFICLLPPALSSEGAANDSEQAVVKSEFIYDEAPFPSAHASTIAEVNNGFVAAWFGGTREKNPDVGIWVSRFVQNGWSKVVEVANGVQPTGERYPCWNPVLFQPQDSPLLLFYKVGPSPGR